MTQTRRRHGGVDRFARRLGIQTVQGRPGRSRLRLRVASSMVNVYGVAHGGVVFALADAAFAAASNADGVPAVALAMSIQFLEAARVGETLLAEAREQRVGRRAAFYAMTVTGRAGRTIATCQGVVHRRPAGSERPGARPGLWRESS